MIIFLLFFFSAWSMRFEWLLKSQEAQSYEPSKLVGMILASSTQRRILLRQGRCDGWVEGRNWKCAPSLSTYIRRMYVVPSSTQTLALVSIEKPDQSGTSYLSKFIYESWDISLRIWEACTESYVGCWVGHHWENNSCLTFSNNNDEVTGNFDERIWVRLSSLLMTLESPEYPWISNSFFRPVLISHVTCSRAYCGKKKKFFPC